MTELESKYGVKRILNAMGMSTMVGANVVPTAGPEDRRRSHVDEFRHRRAASGRQQGDRAMDRRGSRLRDGLFGVGHLRNGRRRHDRFRPRTHRPTTRYHRHEKRGRDAARTQPQLRRRGLADDPSRRSRAEAHRHREPLRRLPPAQCDRTEHSGGGLRRERRRTSRRELHSDRSVRRDRGQPRFACHR